MNVKRINYSLIILGLVMFFVSCEKKDDPVKGKAVIEISDAPIDDGKVEGAFVTIAEVKVDGKSVEGFNKTTIDLLDYQDGNTFTLVESEIEAKTYNEVTLVLDYDEDESGNSPGCYVADENGGKHALTSTTSEFMLNKSFTVNADTSNPTEMIIDFDLRKCIKTDEQNSDNYEFVTQAEMESGIRLLNKNEVGAIKGNCNDVITNSDKIIVYAYAKGDYNRDNEVYGQGDSNIEFANAVASARVNSDGDYQLNFLEDGEYELHFCSYEEDNSGIIELIATLNVDVIGTIDISSVEVDASTSTTVNVSVISILPVLSQ